MQSVLTPPALPHRPAEAHKGSFGRVLIVAGSRGMSGAACLSGLGALRGGAGLVTVAVPVGIQPVVAAVEPSYLTAALPEDSAGRITSESRVELEDLIAKNSVIAFGPGCGMSDELQALVMWLYAEVEQPLVIDADGINALAQCLAKQPGGRLPTPRGARILTPHPGEFARLTNSTTSAVQQNREELASEFARRHHVILLLKGAQSVITDGERVATNQTGNSGMATGGSGDVLTGLIAALLAQGLTPFDAAHLGAHLHGLAGDLAAAELSQPGLIASDIARYLGKAWLAVS
jgi:NAD(P)H-hydrate epimerase